MSATNYRPNSSTTDKLHQGMYKGAKMVSYCWGKKKSSQEFTTSKDKGYNKQQRLVLVPFGIFAFPRPSPSQSISFTLKAAT